MIYSEELFADMMATELRFAEKVQQQPDYKPHFIIHRQADNTDEWDMYLEGAAANIGYNLFNITYNNCTFGGAADIDNICTLLINPYYRFVLPLPVVPKYKKVVQEILEELDTGYVELDLSAEEAAVLKLLPNGWSSQLAQTYLNFPVTRPFYRLSAGLPMYKHVLQNYSILHPWRARELFADEISAIMHCGFFDWIEAVIAGLQIMPAPVMQSNDFDISDNRYKPNRCTPLHTVPAFPALGINHE